MQVSTRRMPRHHNADGTGSDQRTGHTVNGNRSISVPVSTSKNRMTSPPRQWLRAQHRVQTAPPGDRGRLASGRIHPVAAAPNNRFSNSLSSVSAAKRPVSIVGAISRLLRNSSKRVRRSHRKGRLRAGRAGPPPHAQRFTNAGGDSAHQQGPHCHGSRGSRRCWLIGFDRKELVTVRPVPDVAAWEA
jgi:hypothetical protein